MVNFPASLDNGTTLPTPNGTDKQNSPDHASLHGNTNLSIIAAETKLGTGSSTPASNTLLFGTGAGTSAWTALTSAQLAATLSDETGTGSAVFATSPTLVTPKVDTINESTPGNGVTVGGVGLKSGVVTGNLAGILNTANAVATSNITNASVTANKLATGATSSSVATSQTTASTSYTDLATVGPAVTVTIGANGLALLVLTADFLNSGANYTAMSYTASGATTTAASDNSALANTTTVEFSGSWVTLLTGLTAGSTTFTAKYRVSAGTGTWLRRYISVIPL